MPKAAKPPLIADPRAAEQLKAAASAAGLSLPELAELIFASGVAPNLPTKDGITDRYTLEDLGLRLWSEMQALAKFERPQWFDGLTIAQKAAVIVILRDRGYRTEVIANDLAISAEDVMRTFNAYAAKMGAQVVGIRLDTIAGQLNMAAEHAAEMARDAGDHSAYWRIHKELVQILQSIGIVDKAIHRVEVSHKLDDQTRSELDALVSLRQKQERRKIEIAELQQIENKGDEVPAELKEDYDE